ncbi:hypothetical protein D187_008731 [Cystobacter fuscus DSM 2262]|uniref:Uncharacterized protein n=1 Tax=Cystobacter fuscus (strain ATCC 25194 / DSM 2262 / NBRC 100088 / M29) TaxID=1242864 RepID=S9R0V9_CYSF2|nr:hypothetical protein [Cystobacter fuscus]EPX62543.1 hypothetical protein D187_008731 [Cystobacter fuscus DSM 2262]
MPFAEDFTTLARAADRLKVPSTSTELPGLVLAASRAVAHFLGYPAAFREGVEETVVGQGGAYVWLRAGAVRQLRSVRVRGAELPAGDVAIDCPRAGRLVHRRGTWPFTGSATRGIVPTPLRAWDTGEIVVTFDAGWRTPGQVALALEADPSSTLASELPAELEEAALLTLTALHRVAGRDLNVVSRATGTASVTWRTDASAVPLLAQQLAAPHQKPGRRHA